MELSTEQRQALDLWRRVTVSAVRSDAPDLTARQMAVIMTVHLAPGPHTVRGLASTLGVGKPAITRALDTLSRMEMLQRRRDPQDGRNVLVERTPKGQQFLSEFGSKITNLRALEGGGPQLSA